MRSECQKEGSLVVKRYRIKNGIDPREIKTLPHIMTLMMLKDAILSSLRWYRSLEGNDSVETLADRTFSIVCGAGWASEAIRLLKDLRKQGIVSDEVIRRLPPAAPADPKAVWEECIENPSPETKILHSVRGVGFAHFHDHKEHKDDRKRYKLAYQAVNDLASGEVDVPFVQWMEEDGKRSNLKSCSPIAMSAILGHVYGITGGKSTKPPKLLGEQIMKVGILLDYLVTVMVEEAGIEFDPCASAAESETLNSG